MYLLYMQSRKTAKQVLTIWLNNISGEAYRGDDFVFIPAVQTPREHENSIEIDFKYNDINYRAGFNLIDGYAGFYGIIKIPNSGYEVAVHPKTDAYFDMEKPVNDRKLKKILDEIKTNLEHVEVSRRTRS